MGLNLSKIYRPWGKFARDKRLVRWLVIFASVALYVLLFPLLHQTFGWISVSFSWCFVALAVWFWGLRGGVLSAVSTFLLNVVLLKNTGGELLGGPIAFIFFVSIAAILGRLRDLSLRLRIQLSERKEIEEALAMPRTYWNCEWQNALPVWRLPMNNFSGKWLSENRQKNYWGRVKLSTENSCSMPTALS